MDTVSISISQLKSNPSKAISKASDYPMTIKNRGKVKAYLFGKDLFEKIILCLENCADRKTIRETNFKKGKDFEKVAKEINV